MKKLFILFITLFIANTVYSQDIVDPVTWKTHAEKISETEYYLVFEASILDKWHLYSQYNPDGASLPIEFDSEQKGKLFDFVGKAKESETNKEYSDVWKKEEIFFSKKGVLKQKIKLLKSDVTEVELTLYGQACKTACIQIEKTAKFDLSKAMTFENNNLKTKKK